LHAIDKKPVVTAENANSRKKLEPTSLNSRGLSFSSCMIGTAAIPDHRLVGEID